MTPPPPDEPLPDGNGVTDSDYYLPGLFAARLPCTFRLLSDFMSNKMTFEPKTNVNKLVLPAWRG
ncbi:hypothetical protein GCM10007350_09580 [Jeongeupia chitinilytica]|uniref:Uncharacterized protein n=1 Tax=Jeongeupia chitinilytica TaxID=1041641 RepID=A0ABQ3GWR9_9NEIS|nr:hypothetical protein GCM10007350_09580 [Jeongeupia chitinilytica]